MGVFLVGVDRSEASARAVRFATRHVGAGGEIHLLHVIPWSPYSFTTQDEVAHRSKAKQAEIDAATGQIMEPMVELVKEAGVEVALAEVRHGDPVDLIIAKAETGGVDQIVVGRTGDSRVRRALFGSLPSHLTQMASVPVTVVP